jgi:hypothetical protein
MISGMKILIRFEPAESMNRVRQLCDREGDEVMKVMEVMKAGRRGRESRREARLEI